MCQHNACGDSRPRLSNDAATLARPIGDAAVDLVLRATVLSASDCIPIHEAHSTSVKPNASSGKVIRVKLGTKGVHFLDFCEDQMACPFTVVVFRF